MSKNSLWFLTVIAVVSVIAYLWVDAAPEPALATDDLVRRFTVVQTSIGNGGNFDGACKSELGNHWQLADFSDIVEFHDNGGSIPDLVDSLRWNLDYGDPEFPSGVWYLVVSYEGELTWYGRQYFVQRHDHHPPRNFLVHANVDNYHISVGSWYGDGWNALCYSETPSPVQAPAPRDKASLTAFYNATHAYGIKWDWDKNWLSDKALNEWYGVETDKQGNVIALELPNNGLRGTIPREIGELTELKRLDLSDNDLAGKIPDELGQLTFLNALNLSGNNLKGEIPDELGTLASLGQVYVKDNDLTGCVPNNLQRVEKNDFYKLKIQFCNMDRAVLEAFYDATGGDQWRENTNWLSDKPLDTWHGIKTDKDGRVVKLDLRRNRLKGNIPNEIADLSMLQVLDLSTNFLSGELPLEMGKLANLDALMISENDDLLGCVHEDLRDTIGRGNGRNDIVFASMTFCDVSSEKLKEPNWPKFVKDKIHREVLPSDSDVLAAKLGIMWLLDYADEDNRWSRTGDELEIRLDPDFDNHSAWTKTIEIKASHGDLLSASKRLHKIVDAIIHEAFHALFQWQPSGANLFPGGSRGFPPPPNWLTEGMAVYAAAVIANEYLTPAYDKNTPQELISNYGENGKFTEERSSWVLRNGSSQACKGHLSLWKEKVRDDYGCVALAVELLAYKVKESFKSWQQRFGQFYYDIAGDIPIFDSGWNHWSWHEPFENNFGMSVEKFYDLYECHKDNGFDLKKLNTCE